jgi:hypothetical protein
VGAEAFSYRTAIPQAQLLINHIKAVRDLPGLESAFIMLSVESNLGNEAMHHQAYVASAGLTKVVVMNEDRDRAGVRTTNDMKRTMVIIMNDAISHLRLCFYKDLVAINGKRDGKMMRKMVQQQVTSFHRIVEPALKPHQMPKEIYNGKMGGGKDDLLMALMLGLYMKNVAASKPEKYGHILNPETFSGTR